jgi:mannose-6-phosphate isomerase
MDVLEPVVQPYAWGSRTAIAEIQGRPAPTPGPEAELWMGAHPSSPSGLVRRGHQTTLDQVIAADPAAELGPGCVARFGPRLSFLLKILAPEKALSIQVHPDRAQAEAGYLAENQRGVPLGDRARNYVDDWPKPELLCAVTRFEVLAGFRSTADMLGLLAALGTERLRPVAGALTTPGAVTEPAALTAPDAVTEPGAVTVPGAVTEPGATSSPGGDARLDALRALLTWPPGQRGELQEDVLAGCAKLAAGDGRYAAACDAVLRIAADHPGDPGVVAALLLNHEVLEPGDAVYMPAGGLHAYVKGVGIELLANSDNVLRAGLTSKHVDVPELLRLVDPAVAVPVISGRQVSPPTVMYDTPAPEFRLYRMSLDSGQTAPLPDAGPRIACCLDGAATLRTAAGRPVQLARGESCFVPASDGDVTAAGKAVLFVAASRCSG